MKISVYVTSAQKDELLSNYIRLNLSLSQFLLFKGLNHNIESNIPKAKLASVACQLYSIANEIDDQAHRETLRDLGGQIYVALEG